MNINSIRVRNFRSLRQLELSFNRLNIFVGKNDSGKSNVLRALDLFFNHVRGYPFDWKQDFCAFAQVPKGRAQEIEVTLEISPPLNFSDSTPVTWTKSWRQGGLHKDKLLHSDRTELSPKNKFGALLKSIRYDYVPAIKGEAYFGRLLGNMHDMLELTVEDEIRGASSDFMTAINAHTGSIIQELLQRLDLDSSIALPANLRDLFAQLDFRSTHNERQFSLGQRGDGIKVRHIPIILRWLAKQAQTLSAPGRPKVITVWGYEEPENNLELGKCETMADEFLADSENIQTFITTHSPAFYSVFRRDQTSTVALFGVKKVEDDQDSEILPLTKDELNSLDDSMGLMPLVAPHYEKALEEIKQIKLNQADLPGVDKPVLFVEGLTDKTILEAAIEVLFPNAVGKIEIYTRRGAGYNWVADRLIAWAYTDPKTLGVGLFDNDADAKAAKDRVQSVSKAKDSKFVKATILQKSEHLITCLRAGFLVPHAIEELFPVTVWDHAEASNWLEPRSDLPTLYKFNLTNVTFEDHLVSQIPDPSISRYVRMKVKLEDKARFASYVEKLKGEQRNLAFAPLQGPVNAILKLYEVF